MAAVACSKILKELAKEEEDTDSLEEMLALADECEHRAIGELGRGGRGRWHTPPVPPGPWSPASAPAPARPAPWGRAAP